MRIAVVATAQEIDNDNLINKSAVMFDILRASSTVCTALANGCPAVIPVVEVADAFTLAEQLPENTFLLGGERGAVKVNGFQLGNSPLEYVKEVVAGKTVVLTTTNGTRSIRRAAEGAGTVFIGSLLNARAVGKRLIELNQDVVLVCAGTRGKYSLEDTLAAGMVIQEVVKLWQKRYGENIGSGVSENKSGDGVYLDEVPLVAAEALVLEDAAVAALRLAEVYYANPLRALYDSLHGQKLLQLGLKDDLAYCAQLDLFDLVPVYWDGKIILG